MQTFLPSPDFRESVSCLDFRRLGKQRVEAWQVWNALARTSGGWVNHPAVRMWRGHGSWLLLYGVEACLEWIRRGYRDSMLTRFVDSLADRPWDPYPPWLGLSELHSSHRGNLIRKDPIHYGSLGWTEGPMMGYHWPVS